jgi:hypothetical protein
MWGNRSSCRSVDQRRNAEDLGYRADACIVERSTTVIPHSEAIVAPDFALPEVKGETVKLSDYRGKQPVVLIFNRGLL